MNKNCLIQNDSFISVKGILLLNTSCVVIVISLYRGELLKLPILRGLAELYGAVSEPSCGLIEEGIKGADGHCLAFSAGPTFATCIAAPSASRWAS
ncbi:hypothetical protein ANTRET_LOCUS9257 [Anthophora retusa]